MLRPLLTRPTRRRLIMVIWMATSLTFAVPSAGFATTTVFHSKFKGSAVVAYFSFSNDSCMYGGASIFANNGTTHNTDTGHSSASAVTVFVFAADYCTGQVLVDAYGTADLGSDQLVVDNRLATATLRATVPVFDYNSQGVVEVTIDLTWSATSGPSSSKVNSQQTYPDGSKMMYRSQGTSRSASASGTVSAVNLNLTPVPTLAASINAAKTGEVSLTRS